MTLIDDRDALDKALRLANLALSKAAAQLEAKEAEAARLREQLVSAFNLFGTTTDCLRSGEPRRHDYALQRIEREMDYIRCALAAGARSDETTQLAQSEGRQSGLKGNAHD